MDQHLKSIVDKRVHKVMENLQKNNMLAIYLSSKEEVPGKIAELVKEGETVALGGSMSLFEARVIDHLRSGRYNFLDRYAEGLTREQMEEIYRQSFFADAYITSTNAITLDGRLYNVDGNGNRVAAMIYGPKSVIVVAGINKIVNNMDEAYERLRNIAAPANAVRLSKNTPCAKTGTCMDCKSEDRICSSYVILGWQKAKNRIKLILVGEDLGY
ncbi:MAG: lactate utilization protein [Clostridiaceae bacterium]|nr:lactate utilization protein [Clostridiaceae bacterium]